MAAAAATDPYRSLIRVLLTRWVYSPGFTSFILRTFYRPGRGWATTLVLQFRHMPTLAPWLISQRLHFSRAKTPSPNSSSDIWQMARKAACWTKAGRPLLGRIIPDESGCLRLVGTQGSYKMVAIPGSPDSWAADRSKPLLVQGLRVVGGWIVRPGSVPPKHCWSKMIRWSAVETLQDRFSHYW